MKVTERSYKVYCRWGKERTSVGVPDKNGALELVDA